MCVLTKCSDCKLVLDRKLCSYWSRLDNHLIDTPEEVCKDCQVKRHFGNRPCGICKLSTCIRCPDRKVVVDLKCALRSHQNHPIVYDEPIICLTCRHRAADVQMKPFWPFCKKQYWMCMKLLCRIDYSAISRQVCHPKLRHKLFHLDTLVWGLCANCFAKHVQSIKDNKKWKRRKMCLSESCPDCGKTVSFNACHLKDQKNHFPQQKTGNRCPECEKKANGKPTPPKRDLKVTSLTSNGQTVWFYE